MVLSDASASKNNAVRDGCRTEGYKWVGLGWDWKSWAMLLSTWVQIISARNLHWLQRICLKSLSTLFNNGCDPMVDFQSKSGGRFLVEIHWELLETVLYWRRLRSPPPKTTLPTHIWTLVENSFPQAEDRGGEVLWCHWSSMFALGEGSSVQTNHPPKISSSSPVLWKLLTNCKKQIKNGIFINFFIWKLGPNL